jgi:hypothetical protein
VTVHAFSASLKDSHGYADAPWWNEVYVKAFPNLAATVYVGNDGWAQRAGIDRRISLADGRTITVDEKVRKEDWPDFALERWSDRDRKTPGWVQKSLACEYLAYAFVPTAECYLLPLLDLQRAWRRHGRRWIANAEAGDWVTPSFRRGRDGFGVVLAYNAENGRTWVTESIAVPRAALLAALTDVMRIAWTTAEAA